jgi:iron complex outermembrane receptor protein
MTLRTITGTALALLLAGASTTALAQTAARPQAGKAPAPKPAADNTVSELVITGDRDRPQPGAVVGDIKPEIVLGPAEIQSYGVSSLADLLNEIAPQTRSERGRGGEQPVILLAGRRISGFQEIRDIPPEAILRIDILPEEAALKYGYSANQRVVNIVLRPFFRANTAEAGAGYATEGGQPGASAELGYLRIRRDQRLNIDLKVGGQAALTEDERNLVSRTSGQGFDPAGNVLPAAGASQIDPALPVSIAGVPASAANGQPLKLSDFASTAGVANSSDVGRFRTLAPSSRSAALNAVYARPLFGGIQASFNGTLEAKHTESLQGLPSVALAVPAGDPFSPFSGPVTVASSATSFGPLTQTTDTWSAHGGASFNKELAKWRLSLTGAYDHADTLTHSDTGLDASALQARLAARDPTFDPFAPLPESQLGLRGEDKARSLSDGLNAQFLANGPLITLPAGPLFASLKLGDSETWFASNASRFGTVQTTALSRNDVNGRANLDLPLTSRRNDVLAVLGDLTVNANVNVDHYSDFGTLTDLGYGLNWKPITPLTLIVSHTREEAPPSVQQLGGPLLVTPGARIFDFVTGRTVDVRSVSGGNAALTSDVRNVTKLGLTLKPYTDQDLTFTANYVRSVTDNPIRTFPAVTAAIQAAFPDRFVRDASGQLTQVDLRPVNFASETVTNFRWGMNFQKRLGPVPPPRPAGRPDGARGAPGGGGGGARGGGGGGPRGGGGGFGGGGFPGGPFGGPPPTVVQFAVYHTVYFEDQFLVRPGGPRVDLLHGDAGSSLGGQPRHEVEVQAGLLKNGYGLRLSADWKSGTDVRDPSSPLGDLSFSDIAKVDLRLFADLGSRRDLVAKYPFFRGARVSMALTNIFDQRISVRDATGATPISYQPAYLDPVGRKIAISFRKLFFPTPPVAPPAPATPRAR